MFENIKANWQLQGLLRDASGDDKDKVLAAIDGLKAFVASDERALKAIVDISGHSDPELREAAVGLLLSLGGDKVVDPLMTRLKDPNERVRSAAARGLGELSNIKNVEPFTKALVSKDAFVRGVAARTL